MNKQKLVIKVLCNWKEDISETFEKKNPIDSNIKFISPTSETEPDCYLIMNKAIQPFIPKKSIVFHVEPKGYIDRLGVWKYPPKEFFLDVRDHSTYPNYFEWHLGMTYNELMTKSIPKTKVLSTIVSDKEFDVGHLFRLNFLRYLEKYNEENNNNLPIDIYGTNHLKTCIRSLPEEENKNDGILDYKYHFQAENNSEQNYITEKLWDCILAECVCFYWGCPNVGEYVNPACYILMKSDDFPYNLVTIQNAIKNDEWSKRIGIIRSEKKRLLETYNITTIIRDTLRSREINVYVVCNNHKMILKVKNSRLFTLCKMIYTNSVIALSWNNPKIINRNVMNIENVEKGSYVLHLHKDEPYLLDNYEKCLKILGMNNVGRIRHSEEKAYWERTEAPRASARAERTDLPESSKLIFI
jgi:Glycosyltransferase family 10 (fucosyltransferase) C-term